MMDLNLDKKQHVLKTELSSRGVKFESLFWDQFFVQTEINDLLKTITQRVAKPSFVKTAFLSCGYWRFSSL